MPKITVTEPHRLPKDEALKRIKGLLGQVKAQYADQISNLQEQWDGYSGTFSFAAMGFSVSGTLTVTDQDATVKGDLPLLAGMFKGRIEQTIRERARQLLV